MLTVSINDVVPHLARDHAEIPALAAELEALGADQLVLGEHLLMSPGLPHPEAPDVNIMIAWPDPFAVLAAAAARTSRVALATGGVLGAARPAVVIAKLAATVDALSQGRFRLGLVAGWFDSEFAAIGVPFNERFERVDELIGVCRALWGPQPASFSGRWTSFDDMVCLPTPISGSELPIWFGGRAGPGTARRVAGCDGWFASEAASIDEIRKGIGLIEEACVARGRSPEEVGVRANLPRTLREGTGTPPQLSEGFICDEAWRLLLELAAVGVTDIKIPIHYYARDRDMAARILTDIISRLESNFGPMLSDSRPLPAGNPSGRVLE